MVIIPSLPNPTEQTDDRPWTVLVGMGPFIIHVEPNLIIHVDQTEEE
jgi:hypothetical protein